MGELLTRSLNLSVYPDWRDLALGLEVLVEGFVVLLSGLDALVEGFAVLLSGLEVLVVGFVFLPARETR